MAHAFDTKLAQPQRTIVRAGAVAALEPLLKSEGGYLALVAPFGGIVRSWQDDAGIDQLWMATQGQTPAILVATGDKTYAPAGAAHNWQSGLELIIYVVSRNPRSLVARLATDAAAELDDTIDPGIDVILEHVEQAIVGKDFAKAIADFGPGAVTIKQARPVREEELATTNALALWTQTYTVPVTRTIDPNRDLVAILLEFMTTFRTTIAAYGGGPDETVLTEETIVDPDGIGVP